MSLEPISNYNSPSPSGSKPRTLLWMYSGRSDCISFYGRAGIDYFFGRFDDCFSMAWEGFLEQSVHPEDRGELADAWAETLERSVRKTQAENLSSILHVGFRLRLFGQDHWQPVDAIGSMTVADDGNIEIGGVFQCSPETLSISPAGQSETPEPSFSQDGKKGRRAVSEDLRRFLDTMPLACTLWNTDAVCVECNEEAVRLFELPDRESVIRNFAELSPEFQPDGKNSMKAALEIIRAARPRGIRQYEWSHQHPNGELLPARLTVSRFGYENEDLIAVHIEDLRELRSMRDERDQQRQRLFDILNASPVCFANLVDDRIRLATPYMTQLLGIRIGDKLSDFLPDRAVYAQWIENVNRRQAVEWHPIAIRAASGENKEMLACLNYLHDDRRDGIMIWLVDVTEMRRVETDLRQARDAAEDSAKAKSEFLANMSHEIRTPMNAILGMTHLALRTELTPQQKKYLESTEHSAKLLLRIINDILDFSKIEAGKMLMEYHEFSLKDVMADLNSIVFENASKRGLTVEVEQDPEIPKYLMGDSVRLRQVLVNLMTNAIKFTDPGGTVRIAVSVKEQDVLSSYLLFSVTDTGIGMTPQQVKALFRPFTQADTSTTRKYGGTGLGLAICKKIVEQMKGEIRCESHAGKGTTFWFTANFGLPLEGEKESTEIRTDVLLLGDDHKTLKEIRNYLELLKCKTVAQCESLEEFDRFLKSDRMNEVDFIIFDFDEIQHHGKPMIRELQAKIGNKLPPIYFTEHHALDRLLEETGLTRPDKAIHKPIVVSELFDVLVSLTEYKKSELAKIRLHSKDHETEGSWSDMSDCRIPDSIRGARILLAEDNRINQMVATELLTMEGFLVDIAENGRQAVEKIETNQYDLVLMDIQMPEMDGLEATRKIRAEKRFSQLPILAMTAHAMSGDRELSLEVGMNDHITKPIEPKLLFQSLVKWLKPIKAAQAKNG